MQRSNQRPLCGGASRSRPALIRSLPKMFKDTRDSPKHPQVLLAGWLEVSLSGSNQECQFCCLWQRHCCGTCSSGRGGWRGKSLDPVRSAGHFPLRFLSKPAQHVECLEGNNSMAHLDETSPTLYCWLRSKSLLHTQ